MTKTYRGINYDLNREIGWIEVKIDQPDFQLYEHFNFGIMAMFFESEDMAYMKAENHAKRKIDSYITALAR